MTTPTPPRDDAPNWEGFGRAIMEEWQDHGDIEAGEKFDLAVKFGILIQTPGGFDPDKHVDAYSGDSERGDPWYQMCERRADQPALTPAAQDDAERVAEAARVLLSDNEACLRFAEGFDREDAAQMGEPSPHIIGGEDYAAFAADRISCVKAGLRALGGR